VVKIKRGACVTQQIERSLKSILHSKRANVYYLEQSSWFEKTLGFTLDNKEQLASQIKLDPRLARPSRSTAWGITYEQPARIVGANGRTLENCRIYWQQNDETGLFEFKNLLLPKKN
jgi:hypothetical protein